MLAPSPSPDCSPASAPPRPRWRPCRIWPAVAAPAAPSRSRARPRPTRELAAIAKAGGRLLVSTESDYPAGLAALEAPPPVLTVLGHASLLARDMIAIVGARNASALGRKLATRLAADLAAAGLVVASGMARGIDAAAHDGALDGRHRRRAGRRRRHRLSAGEPGAVRAHLRGGRGGVGNDIGTSAAGAPFPAPQPHHLRAFARRRDCRSGRRLRLADHRALCASNRDARFSPCPARRSIRAPRAPTG